MRSVTLSPQEQQEREAAERKQRRQAGFDLMAVRDRGWTQLSNGVTFIWPVDKDKQPEGVPYLQVPEGHFVLVIDGKHHLFNLEELQRFTRWV